MLEILRLLVSLNSTVYIVYIHCIFQEVESTQKVLFCNQKRSKTITE